MQLLMTSPLQKSIPIAILTICFLTSALALFLSFPMVTTAAEENSPHQGLTQVFGLERGMSRETVASLGVRLKLFNDNGVFQTYKTDRLPKSLDAFRSYELQFVPGYGLVSITARGRLMEDDPTGSQGTQAYERIKGLLTEKYGQPTSSYEELREKGCVPKSNFYACLDRKDGGIWASFWEPADDYIGLFLQSVTKTSGEVELTYYFITQNANYEALEKELLDSL